MDAKNLSNKLELWIASDGWPFFLQPDGSLTDTIDPSKCDLGWDSLTQFLEWDEDARLVGSVEVSNNFYSLGSEDNYQRYFDLQKEYDV